MAPTGLAAGRYVMEHEAVRADHALRTVLPVPDTIPFDAPRPFPESADSQPRFAGLPYMRLLPRAPNDIKANKYFRAH